MTAFTLPQDLYSPDQLSALVLELKTFRSATQDADTRTKTGSKKSPLLPEPSPLLSTIFKDMGITTLSITAVEDLHKRLETMLNKAPVAHVMLAGMPSQAIKRQLTDWFRKQVSPDMLITFSVRGDLCGGAVIQVGSHIYDFSFKRLLLENKQKIGEIAGRV